MSDQKYGHYNNKIKNMKSFKIIRLIMFFILFNPVLSGQDRSKVFDFPIRPGTKEWQELDNYKDRLNAYNIPEILLENMNTSDLVKTCLIYPEFRLINTRNTLQEGYEYLYSIFNGFRELEKRHDAGAELIKQYSKLNPADIKNLTGIERGEFAFKILCVEILLAQRSILQSLNHVNKIDLTTKSIANYFKMKELSVYYGTFSLITPTLVLGRMMKVNQYQEFCEVLSKDVLLNRFVESSNALNNEASNNIITHSEIFLKQLNITPDK